MHKYFGKKNGNPFIFITIVIVSAIMVVAIIWAIINYNLFNDALRKEEVSKLQNEVIESAAYVDDALNTGRNNGTAIAFDRDVILLSLQNNDDYSLRKKIIGILRSYANAYSYIQSIYVVYDNYDLILTSGEGWFSSSEFYDQYILEYDKVAKELSDNDFSPIRKVTVRSGESVNVVSYIKPIMQNDSDNYAYVVVNIKTENLLHIMNTQKWEDSQNVFITDLYGNQIIDNSQGLIPGGLDKTDLTKLSKGETVEKTIASKRVLYVSWKSDYNNWIYIRSKNLEDVGMPVMWLKNSSLLFFGISIAAILVLMTTLWMKLYRPYLKLAGKIALVENINNTPFNKGIGFEHIENSLNLIIAENTMMQNAHLASIMTSAGAREKTELEIHQQVYFKDFIVLVFSLMDYSNYMDVSLELALIQNLIEKSFADPGDKKTGNSLRFIRLNDAEIALIINNVGESNHESLLNQMKVSITDINAACTGKWAVGISNCYVDIDSLHDAYIEAKEALKFRYFKYNQSYFRYDETSQKKQSYYQVDVIMMDMFSKNLLSLNIDGANKLLDTIVNDIEQQSSEIFYYNTGNIFMQMFDVIASSLRSNGFSVESLFSSEHNLKFLNRNCTTLLQEYEAICSVLNQAKGIILDQESKITKKTLAQRMIEYIDANYDKGLSLSSMAFEFNMTESYLSNQFKEKIGVLFTKYVTRLRIEKAKEMLKNNNDIKLSEIVKKLDMGNVQSFIRVFKKYEGITPGQYRDDNHDSGSGA